MQTVQFTSPKPAQSNSDQTNEVPKRDYIDKNKDRIDDNNSVSDKSNDFKHVKTEKSQRNFNQSANSETTYAEEQSTNLQGALPLDMINPLTEKNTNDLTNYENILAELEQVDAELAALKDLPLVPLEQIAQNTQTTSPQQTTQVPETTQEGLPVNNEILAQQNSLNATTRHTTIETEEAASTPTNPTPLSDAEAHINTKTGDMNSQEKQNNKDSHQQNQQQQVVATTSSDTDLKEENGQQKTSFGGLIGNENTGTTLSQNSRNTDGKITINGFQTMSPTNLAATDRQNGVEQALAKQVVNALQQAKGEDRELTIRLTPPELGTIRIQLQEQNGQMIARLGIEDEAVRNAVERSLPTMRSELQNRDQPIIVADVESLNDFFNENQADEQAQEQKNNTNKQASEKEFSLDGEIREQDEALTQEQRHSVHRAQAQQHNIYAQA